MLVIYPAKYQDDSGEEITTIENDGKNLTTLIRGIRFEGRDFDGLEPQETPEIVQKAMFTLNSGELCNCILEFEMPISIMMINEIVSGTLQAHLKLGKPHTNGGIDKERLQLRLIWADLTVSSQGNTGWFDDGLSELQSAMPQGYLLRCCHTCAFSKYSPLGYGLFGGLACFRYNKQGVLAVKNKGDLFKIWNSMTEYVQETYLCSEFQRLI